MPETAQRVETYRLPVHRWFWLPLGLAGLLVVILLLGLVMISWRSLDRLQPVQAHLAHIGHIEDAGLHLERTLLDGMRGSSIDPAKLARLGQEIEEILTFEGSVHPDSHDRLAKIAERLEHPRTNLLEETFQNLNQLRDVLANERDHQDGLVKQITSDTRTELRLALFLLVLLSLGGAIALLLLRRRIEQPLRDLAGLLERLAMRDYAQVPDSVLNGAVALTQPVFHSYNALVSRLRDLETEHRERESSLEHAVRQATEALLAQSRELARAERLAAVGAVSAGLAHELRNPLAGIQMACTKLQRSVADPEQTARLESVVLELKRVNSLLTRQVEAAHQAPEPLVRLELRELIEPFLALMRYQMPEGIVLQTRIPEGLVCLLPAAELRQALLNLLLNAVQVLGEQGHVTLTAECEADRLVLRVSDDGPGFPQELLRVGVRPFATGRAGGTGLGLSMVRRFVRDHDGDLELANIQPCGAEVTLRLPCGS
jgi:two-component system, NtrC family, sensor kinase